MTNSADTYFEFAEDTYHLLLKEIAYAENNTDLETIFPKLIIGYLFFRQVRGEAFFEHRPPTPGDQQDMLYKMEQDLAERIDKLGEHLSLDSSKTQYNLESVYDQVTSFYPENLNI
ncbi:hypothetical protein KC571_03830 [candidate division WWE3 bacterium]|uniref:Uncharacterized protein n=1 Tax=candidate division WWE3 bacterium TaxID=2053526 RepID=A0A955RQG8_UNCKA|nr:hypothetical protein [candidate division WWE3 bacterium]